MLKIALAQLNPTIGDFGGNVAAITGAMSRAAKAGADLVVFPELCGYYPGDLLEEASFLARLDSALDQINSVSRTVPELISVLGTVRRTLRETPDGAKTVEWILGMVARNEYKRRQAPPIIRVRSRAFGTGRQMPIAAKY